MALDRLHKTSRKEEAEQAEGGDIFLVSKSASSSRGGVAEKFIQVGQQSASRNNFCNFLLTEQSEPTQLAGKQYGILIQIPTSPVTCKSLFWNTVSFDEVVYYKSVYKKSFVGFSEK